MTLKDIRTTTKIVLLFALVLLGLSGPAHASESILDAVTGCIVTFPDRPIESGNTSKSAVSHTYTYSTSGAFYVASFIGNKRGKDSNVGPTDHRTLKELAEIFPALKFVDTSHPILFGRCPGYEFEGTTLNGGKQKGRIVQALDVCILLAYVSDSGKFPSECDAFLDSLTIAVEGIRPSGRPEVSIHTPNSSNDSKSGGFFTTPVLDPEPAQSSAVLKSFKLDRGDKTVYLGLCQMPPEAKREEGLSRKQLELVRDEMNKGIGLKKSSERRFRIGPTEGIEWECKSRGVVAVRGRVFILGDALYCLVYASTVFEKDKVDAFLNSIHFVFGMPSP